MKRQIFLKKNQNDIQIFHIVYNHDDIPAVQDHIYFDNLKVNMWITYNLDNTDFHINLNPFTSYDEKTYNVLYSLSQYFYKVCNKSINGSMRYTPDQYLTYIVSNYPYDAQDKVNKVFELANNNDLRGIYNLEGCGIYYIQHH